MANRIILMKKYLSPLSILLTIALLTGCAGDKTTVPATTSPQRLGTRPELIEERSLPLTFCLTDATSNAGAVCAAAGPWAE